MQLSQALPHVRSKSSQLAHLGCTRVYSMSHTLRNRSGSNKRFHIPKDPGTKHDEHKFVQSIISREFYLNVAYNGGVTPSGTKSRLRAAPSRPAGRGRRA